MSCRHNASVAELKLIHSSLKRLGEGLMIRTVSIGDFAQSRSVDKLATASRRKVVTSLLKDTALERARW